MTRFREDRALPYWLMPWCAFLFMLPSEELIGLTPLDLVFKAIGLGGALLIALVPGRGTRLAGPRALAITALFLGTCAGYFLAPEPGEAWRTLFHLGLCYLTYLMATSGRLRVAEFDMAMRAWLWGAAAASAMTLWDWHCGRVDDNGRAYLNLGLGLTDPNFLMAELLIPFAYALTVWHRPGRRLETLAALGLILATAGVTQSRGGALAMVMAVGVTWVYQRHWWRLAAGAAGLAGVWAFLLPMLGRFDVAEDPTGSGRTEIWAVALQAASEHWFTGVGLGGFEEISAQAPGLYWARAPHNTYLQAVLDGGAWTLAALVLVGVIHLQLPRRAEAGPIRAGIVGLMVAACFLHLMGYRLFWVAWIVAAQVAALRPAGHGAGEAAAPAEPTEAPSAPTAGPAPGPGPAPGLLLPPPPDDPRKELAS